MPPKRIHSSATTAATSITSVSVPVPVQPPPATTTINNGQTAAPKADSPVPNKKAKILDDNNEDNPKYVQPVKDTRPMCRYGANCYRKNPDHFREFRHPLKSDALDEIRSEHEKMKEKARQNKLRSSSSSSISSTSSPSSLSSSPSNQIKVKTISSPPPSPPLPSPPKAKPSTPKKVSSSLGNLDPSKPDNSIDQYKVETYKVIKIFIFFNYI